MLAAAPTRAERHQRALVRTALNAYLDLVAEEAPYAEPAAPLLRFPACTVLAFLDLAASAADHRAVGTELAPHVASWLAGWRSCWEALSVDVEPTQVPGLAMSLAIAGPEPVVDVIPELRLHVETGALTVVYPAAPGRGARVDAGGGDCPVIEGRWVVPRPVPAVTCYDVLGGVHRVPVLDIRDPLLLFDADGCVIPAGSPVPPGEVWVVHLGRPPESAFEGSPRVIEECAPPVGWSRWWLGRVDLAGVTAIRAAVASALGARHGSWRTVAGADRAELEFTAEPLVELLDRDGDAVHASAPRLRLPGGITDVWTVEVRRSDAPAPRRSTAPGGTTIALDEGLPGPVVGRFDVVASAPGHRSVRAGFTVVSNLRVKASPIVRLLTDDGLAPATVTLRGTNGVNPIPTKVRLAPTALSAPVTLRLTGSERSFEVRAELPHCAIRRRVRGQNGAWQTQATSFDLDDLKAGAALDLHLPQRIVDAIGVPDVLAAPRADDTDRQSVRGRKVSTETFRYPLGGLLDGVHLHGSTPLWLMLPDQPVRVGAIRGPEVITGAAAEGLTLVLQGRKAGTKITITVTAPLSPWLPALTAELGPDDDAIALPPPLRARALRVTARPTASSTTDRCAATVDLAGATFLPEIDQPEERAMSRYLAGQSDIPTSPSVLPLLWITAARPDRADTALGRLTSHECAATLAARPRESLLATGQTGLTDAELIEPIVRGSFAEIAFRSVGDPGAVADLVGRAPLAALLLTSPLLPYLSDARGWDLAELDADERALLDIVGGRFDPSNLALLRAAPPTAPIPVHPPAHDQSIPEDLHAFMAHPDRTALFVRVAPQVDSNTSAALLAHALVARSAAQGDRDAALIAAATRHAWIEKVRESPSVAAATLVRAEFAVSGWFARRAQSDEELR